MIDFTKEEKEFLEAYEKNEWKSVKDKKSELSRYQQIAKVTFKKDSRVNIRISSKDVHAIQIKALGGCPRMPFFHNSLLLSKFCPRNINYMPVVKF